MGGHPCKRGTKSTARAFPIWLGGLAFGKRKPEAWIYWASGTIFLLFWVLPDSNIFIYMLLRLWLGSRGVLQNARVNDLRSWFSIRHFGGHFAKIVHLYEICPQANYGGLIRLWRGAWGKIRKTIGYFIFWRVKHVILHLLPSKRGTNNAQFAMRERCRAYKRLLIYPKGRHLCSKMQAS